MSSKFSIITKTYPTLITIESVTNQLVDLILIIIVGVIIVVIAIISDIVTKAKER